MSAATAQSEFEKVKEILESSTPIVHDLELDPSAPDDVLDRIAAALDGHAPHAVIDCDEFTVESLPKLLATAKTGLALPCENYPRLWFRRLEVGFAVIEEPISNAYQLAYSRAFKAAARRTIAPPALSQRDAQGIVALLEQIGPRIALAGAFAVSLIQRRYPSLYDFYKWYGHRDRPRNPKVPEANLGLLNSYAHPPGDSATPNRRERDRLLIEAMLADLRHAYSRGRMSKHDWYPSVLLLRNSRDRTGALFRERLRSVLNELADDGVAPPPLLVVADGRRPPADEGNQE